MGERLAQFEARTGGTYYPDLHAMYEFLDGRQSREAIYTYARTMEMSHLAEGLALQQATVNTLEFVGGQTIDPYTGRPMVEVSLEGLALADKKIEDIANAEPVDAETETAYWYRRRRHEHDVTIAKQCDWFMAHAETGEAFMVVSPYQQEVSQEVASTVLGHWPEKHRAFSWLFRKTNDTTLERTDISIDDSEVGSYAVLLAERGVQIPPNTPSHELAGYIVPLGKLETEQERNEAILAWRRDYHRIHHGEVLPEDNDPEAVAFLEKHADYLVSVSIAVQEALAGSIREQTVSPIVQTSAQKALTDLRCLTPIMRARLTLVASGSMFEPGNEVDYDAIRTLVSTQRYGIWEAMSDVRMGVITIPEAFQTQGPIPAPGAPLSQTLEFMYQNTNKAAARGAAMPGCPGGTKFDLLSQDIEEAKAAIFTPEHTSNSGKIRCIKCRQYVPKREVVKKDCWKCPNCSHEVDICTGKVRVEGKTAITEPAERHIAGNGLVAAVTAEKQRRNVVETANIDKHEHHLLSSQVLLRMRDRRETKTH